METNSKPPQTKWYAVKVLFESVHSGGPDHLIKRYYPEVLGGDGGTE